MLTIDKHGFISSKSKARPKKVVAQETLDVANAAIRSIRERELARQKREGIVIKGRWALGLSDSDAYILSLLQDIGANMIELGAEPRSRVNEADLAANADAEAARAEFEASDEQEPMTEDF